MANDFNLATRDYSLKSSTATMEIGNLFRVQDDDTEDDFWMHVNTNRFYILTGRGGADTWGGENPLMLDNATSLMYSYGKVVAFAEDIPTFTANTSDPSGGSDGDIHLKYIA